MGKKKIKALKSEEEALTPKKSKKGALIEEEKEKAPKTVATSTISPPRKISKKSRRKKTHSPSYEKRLGKISPERFYSLDEALRLVKETAYAKFDATIEAHFNLSIEIEKDDQRVRTSVVLPNGSGKEKRILAFVPMEKTEGAREAGALAIGDEKKIEEIARGVIDFDVIVADPSFMAKLARVAKILGPKGLMPNPKSGTVSSDPVRAIAELKKGKVELKTQSNAPLLHTIIGKVSFGQQELVENFLAVYNALKAAKPAKAKGVFVKALTLCATMGPGIKVDLTSLP